MPQQPHLFEVNGVQLRNQRLDAFDALDVGSRLLGFVSAVVPLVRPIVYAVQGGPSATVDLARDADADPVSPADATMAWLLAFLDDPKNQAAIGQAIRSAFTEMPDADRRFVITKCLGAVRKVQADGKTLTPILSGGTVVFPELKTPVAMLAITVAVAKDMVSDFLSDPAWSSLVAELTPAAGSSPFGSLGTATGSGAPSGQGSAAPST